MKDIKGAIELVRRAKRHDSDAFTELMQLYMKDMYRTAIAILMHDQDAADAISETILTCWEKLGMLRDNKFFKTWMTRILINKCYDIQKQHQHEVAFEEYEEKAVQDETNLQIKEVLSALDEKYRVPMMLFYGQGYKTSEIAEMLHIPKSTVQTRLSRGRDKLAEFYKTERNED